MSADGFAACLESVLKYEGGFSDDPRDSGGATNCGVTLATLSNYRGTSCTVDDVRSLTPEAVAPLYRQLFWSPIRGDDLPAGTDLFAFDSAVNMGVGTAVKLLQEAVGVIVDGRMGPLTLAAVQTGDVPTVISRLSAAREARYRAMAKFPVYGKGWLNRLFSVTQEALEQVT